MHVCGRYVRVCWLLRARKRLQRRRLV